MATQPSTTLIDRDWLRAVAELEAQRSADLKARGYVHQPFEYEGWTDDDADQRRTIVWDFTK